MHAPEVKEVKMPMAEVRDYLKQAKISTQPKATDAAVRMKMLQHQHLITLTPEKRQKYHKEELDMNTALSGTEFCDLLKK